MVNTKQIALEYVNAVIEQTNREEVLNQALQLFNFTNDVYNLAEAIHTPYKRLIAKLVGESTADHLDWWIWSSVYKLNEPLRIDGKAYIYRTLTFDEFWDLIYS